MFVNKTMEERGSMMLFHSVFIGIIAYDVMMLLKQPAKIAENRSILLAAIILIYMIVFGHGLPTRVNPDIF
jgi:uncharacterized protein with PQ loop repeat